MSVCRKCGSPEKISKKTNKPYCSALCWQNEAVKEVNKGERKFVNDINSDIRQQQIDKAINEKNDKINWLNAKTNATSIACAIVSKRETTPEETRKIIESLANWFYGLEPRKEEKQVEVIVRDEENIDVSSIPF